MRLVLPAFCLLALLIFGCKSQPKKTEENKPQRSVRVEVAPDPRAQKNRPVVRAVDTATGRVVQVNGNLRFVIVDFAGQRMPQLEQRFSVYRLDQKVAEIKISGPYLGTTVAADVTAGEARFGDLVKQD